MFSFTVDFAWVFSSSSTTIQSVRQCTRVFAPPYQGINVCLRKRQLHSMSPCIPPRQRTSHLSHLVPSRDFVHLALKKYFKKYFRYASNPISGVGPTRCGMLTLSNTIAPGYAIWAALTTAPETRNREPQGKATKAATPRRQHILSTA